MARNPGHGNCHCGDDELWIGFDELIEVVRMTVQQCLALPDQRLPAAERDRIRARLQAGRTRRGDEHQGDDPAGM